MVARAGGWLDRAIPQIGTMIGRLVRAEDTAARLGPEVFALALPATNLSAARLTAERIAAVIACTAFEAGPERQPFVAEFDIGVAEVVAGESAARALEQAAAQAVNDRPVDVRRLDGSITRYLLPLGIAVVIMIARNTRPRRLQIERLWVLPAIYMVMMVSALVAAPPPVTPVSIGLLVLGFLIGAGLGWQRARFTEIHIHPETHDLTSRSSPIGIIFIFAILVLRYGGRRVPQGSSADTGHPGRGHRRSVAGDGGRHAERPAPGGRRALR